MLNEPRVVLWVGVGDEFDEARTALSDDVVREVRTVDSAATAREQLRDRDDVGCLVAAHQLPDGSGVEPCRSLREAGDETPFVLAIEPGATDAEMYQGKPTFAQEALEDDMHVIEASGATLTVDLPEGTRIHAADSTLRPVFENLFKNAITNAGPDVSITVGATDRGGFYVADDGPGIPVEEREAILESGYTTSEEGSGKGLHIVAETVDDNDWDLAVTESADGGARFEVNNCLMVQSEPTLPTGGGIELTEQEVVGELDEQVQHTQTAGDPIGE